DGPFHESAVLLVEDPDRHPLAHDDQVELTVMVVVHPGGRRHHPDVGEPRGLLERDVAKVPPAVILEQIASRRQPIVARDPTSDEEEVARDRYAGAALGETREGLRIPV